MYVNRSLVRNQPSLVATTIGSNPLTPDMAIEIFTNGRPQQVLIFDAKYRWQREQDGHYYPKQEDIEKMYRYRDNIQYQYDSGKQTRNRYETENIVSSAYILYPGSQIHTEAQNHVGGLPLFPNISKQRLIEVRKQLNDLLYYAYLID